MSYSSEIVILIASQEIQLNEVWFHFQSNISQSAVNYEMRVKNNIAECFSSWLESVSSGRVEIDNQRHILEKLGLTAHYWMQKKGIPKALPRYVINTVDEVSKTLELSVFSGQCSIFVK